MIKKACSNRVPGPGERHPVIKLRLPAEMTTVNSLTSHTILLDGIGPAAPTHFTRLGFLLEDEVTESACAHSY